LPPFHCYSSLLPLASKMFGSSQAFGANAAASPEAKRPKQEEKQTVVPVTVRILEDAVAAAKVSDSDEVLIHGSEAGTVHLVGVIEALVEQTAMIEFTLNDASGRMKVRHYNSGAALAEGLAVGRYVCVTGNLRTSPATHVSAMSLRPVSSADEVSYHMIEVALAALRLRSSAAGGGLQLGGLSMTTGMKATGPDTPSPKKVEGGNLISPMKVDAPMQVMEPESVMSSTMQSRPTTDLRTSLLTVLQEEKDKVGEEGLALAAIVAKLAHCQAPPSKVQQLLSDLVTEGEVFTTIDEEHFTTI
jgi:hypothetical protein